MELSNLFTKEDSEYLLVRIESAKNYLANNHDRLSLCNEFKNKDSESYIESHALFVKFKELLFFIAKMEHNIGDYMYTGSWYAHDDTQSRLELLNIATTILLKPSN